MIWNFLRGNAVIGTCGKCRATRLGDWTAETHNDAHAVTDEKSPLKKGTKGTSGRRRCFVVKIEVKREGRRVYEIVDKAKYEGAASSGIVSSECVWQAANECEGMGGLVT